MVSKSLISRVDGSTPPHDALQRPVKERMALAGGCADSGGAGLHGCCAAEPDAAAYADTPPAASDLAAGQRAAWSSGHLPAERQQLPQAYQRRMVLLHPAGARSNAAQADTPSSSPGWAAPQQGPAELRRAVAAVEARAAAAASGRPAAARAGNSLRQATAAKKQGAGPAAAVPAKRAAAAAEAGTMPDPSAVAYACADVSVRLGAAAAKLRAAATLPVLEQGAAAGTGADVCVRLKGHEPGRTGASSLLVPELGPAALQRAIAAVVERAAGCAAAGAAHLPGPTAGAAAARAPANRAAVGGANYIQAVHLRGAGVKSGSLDRNWFCWVRLLG